MQKSDFWRFFVFVLWLEFSNWTNTSEDILNESLETIEPHVRFFDGSAEGVSIVKDFSSTSSYVFTKILPALAATVSLVALLVFVVRHKNKTRKKTENPPMTHRNDFFINEAHEK